MKTDIMARRGGMGLSINYADLSGSDQCQVPGTEQGCSFCGRGLKEVNKILSGPSGASICDDCVSSCVEMLTKSGGVSQELLQLRMTLWAVIKAAGSVVCVPSFLLVDLDGSEEIEISSPAEKTCVFYRAVRRGRK